MNPLAGTELSFLNIFRMVNSCRLVYDDTPNAIVSEIVKLCSVDGCHVQRESNDLP